MDYRPSSFLGTWKQLFFWEGSCNRSRWLTVGVVCLLCCAVCLLIQRQSLRIITVRRMHKNDPLNKKPHTNSIHISKQYQYFTGCLCWIMSVLWALKAKHLHQQSAFKSKVANLFATIVMRFSCRKKLHYGYVFILLVEKVISATISREFSRRTETETRDTSQRPNDNHVASSQPCAAKRRTGQG